MSEKEKGELADLEIKLDELYEQKVKGAFIRSGKKWLEEGEQNSHYFFNLEKHNAISKNINKLNINGTVITDYKDIANYCCTFYEKLYNSQFSQTSAECFLSSLTVKTISDNERIFCDKPVTVNEVAEAINLLKNNKSGTDGLSAELYKAFSSELSPFLFKVFQESIANECMPPTLTQGLTTLIPKPKKDILFIDNWRPICLLNNDYKILALLIAKRLKSVLNSIIEESQSGFMKNRHITNNIRLVLDILDYPDLIDDDGFILFLDFYKAFDTVEHKFIFQTLNKFGFGDFFSPLLSRHYIRTVIRSSIKLIAGSSLRFNIHRGIRQGCPASPYLFLLVAQLLAYHIHSSDIKGISITNRELVITQLADDTTLFLKEESQIPIAIEAVAEFSRASGLYLNIKKCELMAIKECNTSILYSILVKDEISYLGILITKNQHSRCYLNFSPIIEKTKKKFNQWLLRDLSLRGRTLITKAEGISRLTYAALALDLDKKICKEIIRSDAW